MGKYEIVEINQIKLDGALTILNLNANMESLESLVVQELEKAEYNSIVTMDSYKAMKESSLSLGRYAKQISDFRISKVREETQDIKLFEDSLKKFTNMFKSKQDEIKQGLDVFEEETRQQVKAVCIAYFDEYSLEVGLTDEFKNINLEDMTQTGFMTAGGAISKKGKEEVERRVQVQLNLQNKVQNRLMMLENECLKAGIEPLTKQHIQGFLLSNDDAYSNNLNMLIESELRRAELVKARQEQELRQKIEAENKAKEEATLSEEPKETIKEDPKVEKVEAKVIPQVDSDGKRIYQINFSFEIKALAGVDENKIIEKVKAMMLSEIGIKNLKNVEVN